MCVNGLSNEPQIQDGSMEIFKGVNSLEDGEVYLHNCDAPNGYCINSAEKGPETPVLESSLLV